MLAYKASLYFLIFFIFFASVAQNDGREVYKLFNALHLKPVVQLDILSLSHHSKSSVLFEMPQSEIHYVQYSYDRQAIHPHALESPIPHAELPQSQAHYADSATAVQSYTCDSNKRLPPFCFPLTCLSCQLPHHRGMENCTYQQFQSHLYLSISQSFDCKII